MPSRRGRFTGFEWLNPDATPRGLDRRSFLRLAAAAGASAALPFARNEAAAADLVDPLAPRGPGQAGAPMARFPEKTDLILLTDRPPQLETPVKYFTQDLTPNDAFFVRWHLSIIPTSINAETFGLSVAGHVNNELDLSLEDLRKQFEPASIVAVNQCSGNSRSFSEPRVPGGQWGNGACGNARWTGVWLKDLLNKAGVKAGAVDVSFQGLDHAPLPTVAPFAKSVPIDHALGGDCLVAYEMNGRPMPMLNGYPLRLIVPGWFGTYWVKTLKEINVLDKPFAGFWVAKSYRVPNNPRMAESPKELAKDTVPITKMPLRSMFALPETGTRMEAGREHEIAGVAFDSGSGIAKVEVSTDGGKTWSDAKIGQDLGKYSWRVWKHPWRPSGSGSYTLMARATSNAGETQPTTPIWNRAGYGRNIVESVTVTVA